jgi:pre-rRNA-processing protein TSR4
MATLTAQQQVESPFEDAVVLIGVPATTTAKKVVKRAHAHNSPYESYLGGLPGYFNNDNIVDKNTPICKTCSTPLILVSQVYAPVEYHRSLLIFGCNNGICTNRNSSWKVYRTQDIENSEDSTNTTTSAHEHVQNSVEEMVEKPVAKIDLKNTDAWAGNDFDALLAMRDQLTNNGSSNKNKNQKVKKKKKKKKKSNELEENLSFKLFKQNDSAANTKNENHEGSQIKTVTFPQININIIEEPYEEQQNDNSAIHKKYKNLINNPMQEYTYGEDSNYDIVQTNKTTKMSKKDAKESNHNNNNTIDLSTAADGDQFYQRILRVPNQCMRYAYGSNPLLPPSKLLNSKSTNNSNKNRKQKKKTNVVIKHDVPKCSKCNGNRLFEMQLMPSLLSTIEDAGYTNNMSWETILIYSCENSCKNSYEEHVIVIYDPDEEQLFNKKEKVAGKVKPSKKSSKS